jgi:hypothetical protein
MANEVTQTIKENGIIVGYKKITYDDKGNIVSSISLDANGNIVLSNTPQSASNQSQPNNQTNSSNSSKTSGDNPMQVNVGDTVQIIDNGIDVTNGNIASAGVKYGKGGPLWGKVEGIFKNWETGKRWGLPERVTKVRVKADNSDLIVWQVQPEHIAPNIIRSSQPELIQTEASQLPPVLESTPQGLIDLSSGSNSSSVSESSNESIKPYATGVDAVSWTNGYDTSKEIPGNLTLDQASPKHNTKQVIEGTSMGIITPSTYKPFPGIGWRYLNNDEKKHIGGSSGLMFDSGIMELTRIDMFDDHQKRSELLNELEGNIQNSEGFPKLLNPATTYRSAEYDYKIDIGDSTSSFNIVRGLEDRLMDARAAFGIPIHGNNVMAKAMKFYMYNRFRTPDTNLAHNKSFTYVFFTRPDLNLLKKEGGITAKNHILNHTETAMLWRRNPELFKLLTDRSRCGDQDNFNMLLSNQCTSFDIQDETLTTNEAGKSWNEYEMAYGNMYTARSAGEFPCNFTETATYDVTNLIKLWMTYIDMVARGAWSPSYDLTEQNKETPEITDSYVFTKTLDYAASAYVFKCGPDGQDILYWSKYFGIFPINTGASALSWDETTPVGSTPKLNIRFRYSFKRDLNPVSLIEFNRASNIKSPNDAISEEAFNPEYGHSNRPYVGAPFVEMLLRNPKNMNPLGGVNRGPNAANSILRLKFKKYSDRTLTDELIYRNGLAGRSSRSNKGVEAI